jgi:hypothetical protein
VPAKAAPVPQRYHGAVLGHRYPATQELWWDDEVKPCTVCKGPTRWRRPRKRGAATHPLCEGTVFDSITDELYADLLFMLHSAFDVTETIEGELPKREARPRRLGNPQAGCALPGCGRPYAALWIVGGLWACPQHSLIPIRYRRY